MAEITLKDIMISARQESYRMRHFYLGVEHTVIALLEISGGLTSNILQEQGLAPDYIIDAIRRKVGKGSRHRLWAGIPNTPRTEVVLGIANDLALETGRKEIIERDMLLAILEERDSVPIRVFESLGLDVNQLIEMARTYGTSTASQQSFVTLDFGATFDRAQSLSKDQLFVLRRMFRDYTRIRVDARLSGGYTAATLLVVTPIRGDGREDAAVVVKLDKTATILDEAQRYETHVRGTLPPLTARLEAKPTAPDTSELAAIRYTLVAESGAMPRDLRSVIGNWDGEKLGRWIAERLFSAFGRIWWQQRRPYRFQVWREYDWLLPPFLILEAAKSEPPQENVLRFPLKREKLAELEYGDIVAIENFIVEKVYSDRGAIQLAIGQGTDAAWAFKIEVRELDLGKNTHYRGEVIERIVGKIWNTRNEQLKHAIRALEPDFELDGETIPVPVGSVERLPNPIRAYEDLLSSYVNGSLSIIHGDLHLGNILLGPNEGASLIDFAHTRDGHTVFDWASLEISLLSEFIMPLAGENWSDTRSVLPYVAALNARKPLPDNNPELAKAFAAVKAVRDVANRCLAAPDGWAEYYIALVLCALRAVTWETMKVGSRRLIFLVAALTIHELYERYRPEISAEDETDFDDSR